MNDNSWILSSRFPKNTFLNLNLEVNPMTNVTKQKQLNLQIQKHANMHLLILSSNLQSRCRESYVYLPLWQFSTIQSLFHPVQVLDPRPNLSLKAQWLIKKLVPGSEPAWSPAHLAKRPHCREALEAAASLAQISWPPRLAWLWGADVTLSFILDPDLSHNELDYVAPAEGADWHGRTRGCWFGLIVAAQGERALCTHLMATCLNLDRANLIEAYAAKICFACLQSDIVKINISIELDSWYKSW